MAALLLALSLPLPAPAVAQAGPTQDDIASYHLEARLEPVTRQVHGRGRIDYRNPSPDRLDTLWLHLYLNAFQSPDTLWMREAGGVHRANGYDPAWPGWIRLEQLRLTEGGVVLTAEPADADGTIARVALPTPLGPGERLSLEVVWTAQLPRVFARTGFADDFYMVGQWYPKLAVYDRGRWDTEPWHANAEFFADFGTYDLTLRLPSGYRSGASGQRLEQRDQRDGTQIVRYRAERVTDVAWTAWSEFVVLERQVEAAGRPIQLELLLPPEQVGFADRQLAASQAALDAFGRWYGPYPWPKLTLVVPPAGAEGAGGMEYPTLVTTDRQPDLPFGLGAGLRLLEVVTIHEIAHQWFPLQVQTNEAREPWLDEGFADYLTIRLLDRLYPADRTALDLPFVRLGYGQAWRGIFLSGPPRAPLAQPAWALESGDYGAVIYGKGSQALLSLEAVLGDQPFTAALGGYAERWRWRHPTTTDLQVALEAATGQPLGWFFQSVVHGSAVVEYRVAELAGPGAVVERVGEATFPVEVRLRFDDGTDRLERWPGQTQRLVLADPGRAVASVELDPAHHLALQLDRLDDRRTRQPDPAAPLTLANRWLSLIQALLQLAGQLG